MALTKDVMGLTTGYNGTHDVMGLTTGYDGTHK